ncbi:cubilin-like protein 2 [Sarcoptes scabiei]|uniref:Cubilin-like protein 2 n=1 Tax=Sarcoptes scabiei TaxID=52283 RepID=A0A132A757_SARSC|nr:cubilin-like protein 2 [Sarcoptes scabiei]
MVKIYCASDGISSMYCEKRFMDLEFEIKSKNYPKNYSNNLDCVYYIIRKSSDICGLELKFIDFNLEQSDDCSYDYFEIDGELFCGRLPPNSRNVFRFDTAFKSISFQTDSQNTRSGFHIKLRQITDCSMAFIPEPVIDELRPLLYDPKQKKQQQRCHFHFKDLQNRLESLEYPNSYPNNIECQYKIEKNRDHHDREFCFVQFSPLVFDLEQSENCSADYLQIVEKRFCGQSLMQHHPFVIPFNQNDFVNLWFHTNSHRTEKGFQLDYKQVPCDYNFITSNDIINLDDQHSHSSSFSRERLSPFNGGDDLEKLVYRAQEPCHKIYQTKKFNLISDLIDGHYKDNQASTDCQYDYMEIGTAVRLCGTLNQKTDRIYSFDRDEIEIRFHSDATNEQKGFQIKIEQLECDGDRIIRNARHPQDDDLIVDDDRSKDYLLPQKDPKRLEQFKLEQREQFIQQQRFETQADFLPNKKHLESLDLLQKSKQKQSFEDQRHLPQQRKLSKFEPSSSAITDLEPSQTDSSCSRTFMEMEFFIQSPGFPQNYPLEMDCLYLIVPASNDIVKFKTPGLNVCFLEIQFIEFELQPTVSDCANDYTSNFRPRKGFRLQGRQIDCLKNDFYTGLTKNIGHQQNDSQQKSLDLLEPNNYGNNFNLFLPQLPSICEICVTEVTGQIQSYDYPNFYPPNLNCTYRITPLPNNCMVELRFDQFEFDFTPECNQDYLEINSIRYCGQQLKDVSMLLLNKRKDDLLIRMVTSSRSALVKSSFRGFRANYVQLACLDSDSQQPHQQPTGQMPNIQRSQQPASLRKSSLKTKPSSSDISPPDYHQRKKIEENPSQQRISNEKLDDGSQSNRQDEPIYCDETFDDKHFELKSPGYPYRYFNNLQCSYLIRKNNANVCQLRVIFNQFNLVGEDRNCGGDYLDIFSTRFCGVLKRFTSKEIPFSHEKILMHFHSNEARTANGFHLSFEQIDCLAAKSIDSSSKKSEYSVPEQSFMSNYPESKGRTHQKTSKNGQALSDRKSLIDDKNNQIEQIRYGLQTIPNQNDTLERSDGRKNFQNTHQNPNRQRHPPRPQQQKTFLIEPEVIYMNAENESPSAKEYDHRSKEEEEKINYPEQQNRNEQRKLNTLDGFPLRYYSRNITVTDENGNYVRELADPSRQQQHLKEIEMEEIPSLHHQKHQIKQQNLMPKLCDEITIEKPFFELKYSDLRFSRSGSGSCHLLIQKSKQNICQLDVMFARYQINDPSCTRQFVSIDGERICGHVHESTMKKFWFIDAEIYLAVKLDDLSSKSPSSTPMISDENFELKFRQIECASNVDSERFNNKPNGNNGNEQQQRRLKPFQSITNGEEDQITQKRIVENNRSRPQEQRAFYGPKTEWKMHEQIGPKSSTSSPSTPSSEDRKKTNLSDRQKSIQNGKNYDPHCDLIENELNFELNNPHPEDIDKTNPLLRCRYTVRKANDKICAIDVHFETFRLKDSMRKKNEDRMIELQFISDANGNGRGFNIEYKQEKDDRSKIVMDSIDQNQDEKNSNAVTKTTKIIDEDSVATATPISKIDETTTIISAVSTTVEPEVAIQTSTSLNEDDDLTTKQSLSTIEP